MPDAIWGITSAMSDTFKQREHSFEAKQKIDDELRFKAEARRNRLVGLWAAEKMGIKGTDAEAYAKTVVISDLEEPGDGDVIRKIVNDFTERRLSIDEGDIREQLQEKMQIALQQLSGEYPEPLGNDHEKVGD